MLYVHIASVKFKCTAHALYVYADKIDFTLSSYILIGKRIVGRMIAKMITFVMSFQTYIYLNKSTLTSYLRVVYCICCIGNASLYYARTMCPATRGIILGLFDKKSNTSGTGETKYRQYSNWD